MLNLPTIRIVLRRGSHTKATQSNSRTTSTARSSPQAKTSEPKKQSPGSSKTTPLKSNSEPTLGRKILNQIARAFLEVLDVIAIRYGKMLGKEQNYPMLWKYGCAIMLVAYVMWLVMHRHMEGLLVGLGAPKSPAHSFTFIAQIIVPAIFGYGGLSMVVGGLRLQQGKSFISKYSNDLEPIPAFASGVEFKLGDVRLSLKDTHTGILIFGGIGSGKTVSLMVPLLRQFFRNLRDEDDTSEFAKCGALIIDEKGDFSGNVITEMNLARRNLEDLVVIDAELDLFRYNPIDPNQTADANAEKLAKIQQLMGGGSGKDNPFWDTTSKRVIRNFIFLLMASKPKGTVGLDDIARLVRENARTKTLCNEVEATIRLKRENNDITRDDYQAYEDALSCIRIDWLEMPEVTQGNLKATIANMLGPIAADPKLQKVFCRDTNFSFKDLADKGKVVIFRKNGINQEVARLLCVALKLDFQAWQKRRNGEEAERWGINATRTVLFVCDEYQEFLNKGDDEFYAVCRSTKTAAIVATQGVTSFKAKLKNEDDTKNLIQSLCTVVFLKTIDDATFKLGEALSGKSKQEDTSQSQNTTGFLNAATDLSGGSGKSTGSVNISKKLEENFRADDFMNLVTMTKEKSLKGPWYSEAIIFHYNDIDLDAVTRCKKTKIHHLYYDKELLATAKHNVRWLDDLMYNRTSQHHCIKACVKRKQRINQQTALKKKEHLESLKAKNQALIAQQALTANPSGSKSNSTNAGSGNAGGNTSNPVPVTPQNTQPKSTPTAQETNTYREQKQAQIDQERKEINKGHFTGSVQTSSYQTPQEIQAEIQSLKAQKAAVTGEDQRLKIDLQLNHVRRQLSVSLIRGIQSAAFEDDSEAINANAIPYNTDEHQTEEEEDNTVTYGAPTAHSQTISSQAKVTPTNPPPQKSSPPTKHPKEDEPDLWELPFEFENTKIQTAETGYPVEVITKPTPAVDPFMGPEE